MRPDKAIQMANKRNARHPDPLRCTCGVLLGATWPYSDQWGRPVCTGCMNHENDRNWPKTTKEREAPASPKR